MSENAIRTPPEIVAAADKPVAALVVFIAQELDHWGFGIVDATDRGVLIQAEGREFMVGVTAS